GPGPALDVPQTQRSIAGRRQGAATSGSTAIERYHLTGAGLSPAGTRQLRLTHRNRKFVDAPLEGDGFEPLVPRESLLELWEAAHLVGVLSGQDATYGEHSVTCKKHQNIDFTLLSRRLFQPCHSLQKPLTTARPARNRFTGSRSVWPEVTKRPDFTHK